MSKDPKAQQQKKDPKEAVLGFVVLAAMGYGIWSWVHAPGATSQSTLAEQAPSDALAATKTLAEKSAAEQKASAEQAARLAAKAAEDAEEKRKGFHCLSPWDGSQPAFTRLIKDQLRNPSSFEHIETKVWPVDSNGRHKVLTRFRAENGFGGINVGKAFGSYAQANCADVKLEGME